MRFAFFTIVLGPLLLAAAQARSPEVVVTAFGPYGSHPTNPSIPIGRALVKHLKENGIHARFCELPVTYGGAFAKARRCIEGARKAPKLVFSLGGSGRCVAAELETTAENWIGDQADTVGLAFVSDVIEERGPKSVTLPYDPREMLAGLSSAESGWIELSKDMGDYVCNDFGYEMARFLGKGSRYSRTRFAFLHVPSDACPANFQDVELWSPLATKMILAALGARAKTPLDVHFVPPPPPKPISLAHPKIDLPPLNVREKKEAPVPAPLSPHRIGRD